MNKIIITLFSLSLCIQGVAQETMSPLGVASYKKLKQKVEVKKLTKKRLKKYAGAVLVVALVVAGIILGAKKSKAKHKDEVGLFVDLGLKTSSK